MKEQDNIIGLVAEYSIRNFWIELHREYGSILDNMAKMCYTKMLSVAYGDKSEDDLRKLPESEYSVYGHLVLSHAFMEFFLLTGLQSYSSSDQRPAYDRFCEANSVPNNLIEIGWQEYLED